MITCPTMTLWDISVVFTWNFNKDRMSWQWTNIPKFLINFQNVHLVVLSLKANSVSGVPPNRLLFQFPFSGNCNEKCQKKCTGIDSCQNGGTCSCDATCTITCNCGSSYKGSRCEMGVNIFPAVLRQGKAMGLVHDLGFVISYHFIDMKNEGMQK